MTDHFNAEVEMHIVDDRLTCPACGGQSLHQGLVAVFYRDQEDAPATVTIVHANDVTQVPNAKNSPSARRDGVLIDMECENCEAISKFAVWQHKGSTYMAWAELGQSDQQT